MVNFEEILLSCAIAKAWETQTFALPNPSVGALILSQDLQILALESHSEFGSSHAELKALKEAFFLLTSCNEAKKAQLNSLSPKELWEFLSLNHNGIFNDCSVFVTLEPCIHDGKTPSCAKLLSILKPKKVVFGAYDPTKEAQGGAKLLQSYGIEVMGGVCLKECLDLLFPFLTYLKKGRFNLFKIAQRLNGNYKDGQISNQASKIFTHIQRSNATSLVVSGKTIRTDRPKLDTRYAPKEGKLPKIQILSRVQQEGDCLKHREVKTFDQSHKLELESGFNLIEGGYPLLMSLKEKIDGLLLFVAPFFDGHNSPQIEKMEFELLYSQTFSHINRDIALWLKPKNLA